MLGQPIVTVVDWPLQFYANVHALLMEKQRLMRDRDALAIEVSRLQAAIQRLQAYPVENQALRRLWQASQRGESGISYQLANLVTVSLDPHHQWYLLDQGDEDGVEPQQGVLDADGVVGQIIHTQARRSVVMLLSDHDSALPVEVGSQSWRAIAVGTGKMRRLRLLYVPDTANIQVGDEVNIAAIAHQFPTGYRVGHVASVERSSDLLYSQIEVISSSRLSRGDVMMITHRQVEGRG